MYVGGLPDDVTADEFRGLFAPFGAVAEATLILHDDGRPRGFGFIVMAQGAAETAIAELDGSAWRDSQLRVNVARNRGAKPPRRAY
ncbi:MAG: RNA-binding protein [bacterium]|nr:RNA-binding protein [bacterium]